MYQGKSRRFYDSQFKRHSQFMRWHLSTSSYVATSCSADQHVTLSECFFLNLLYIFIRTSPRTHGKTTFSIPESTTWVYLDRWMTTWFRMFWTRSLTMIIWKYTPTCRDWRVQLPKFSSTTMTLSRVTHIEQLVCGTSCSQRERAATLLDDDDYLRTVIHFIRKLSIAVNQWPLY